MADGGWHRLLTEAAGSLGLAPGPVVLTGAPGGLPSRLPVADTAVACVATALTAAAGLQRQRGGPQPRDLAIDAAHVTAAVRSESHLLVGGRSLGGGFAPLSRFWPTHDGWVRTHGNYPWHRDALSRALGAGCNVEAIGVAIGERTAAQVEDEVFGCGGVAAAVRTPTQWRAHPQGRAVVRQPLIASRCIGDAPGRGRPAGELPASELRVLDLTRVTAGPVATRYLAALGADVLRVDPPHRPELPLHRYDGLPGKRSAVLDARTGDGLRLLHDLLACADVVVHGYRPGALAAFGLDAEALADRHPGLVAVSLSAWGRTGPWGARRGFDSIVQAACGIAVAESPDGRRPGRLPCQLLDHGTGYLAAAAALEGVRRQADTGGTHVFELSLAATAGWLLDAVRPATAGPAPPDAQPPAGPPASQWMTTLGSDAGPVTMVTPPGTFGGRTLTWRPHLTTYGHDAPSW